MSDWVKLGSMRVLRSEIVAFEPIIEEGQTRVYLRHRERPQAVLMPIEDVERALDAGRAEPVRDAPVVHESERRDFERRPLGPTEGWFLLSGGQTDLDASWVLKVFLGCEPEGSGPSVILAHQGPAESLPSYGGTHFPVRSVEPSP